MASRTKRRSETGEAPLGPDAVAALGREFEDLGLSPYESRILVALLCLGTAGTLQLSELGRVPRSSIYANLERLGERGLAHRLAVGGTATWASPGIDEVFRRLDKDHEEHLRAQRERATRVRELAVQMLPDTPIDTLPYVHFLRGGPAVERAYGDILASARVELVIFTRPPYARVASEPDPVVLEVAGRGLRMRALYQRKDWEPRHAAAFRKRMGVYHAAGVEGRVVDEPLPAKLSVVDRKVTLMGIDGPAGPQKRLPTHLLVEDPGFAILQATAFEHYWARGAPA